MRANEAAKIVADGSRAVIDPDYEPKGVAQVVKSKDCRLTFLHDRLYAVSCNKGATCP